MELSGKISKVAICEKCGGFVMASIVGTISRQSEKEFTEFSNEGFTIKLETIEETKARKWCDYEKCKSGQCI